MTIFRKIAALSPTAKNAKPSQGKSLDFPRRNAYLGGRYFTKIVRLTPGDEDLLFSKADIGALCLVGCKNTTTDISQQMDRVALYPPCRKRSQHQPAPKDGVSEADILGTKVKPLLPQRWASKNEPLCSLAYYFQAPFTAAPLRDFTHRGYWRDLPRIRLGDQKTSLIRSSMISAGRGIFFLFFISACHPFF